MHGMMTGGGEYDQRRLLGLNLSPIRKGTRGGSGGGNSSEGLLAYQPNQHSHINLNIFHASGQTRPLTNPFPTYTMTNTGINTSTRSLSSSRSSRR